MERSEQLNASSKQSRFPMGEVQLTRGVACDADDCTVRRPLKPIDRRAPPPQPHSPKKEAGQTKTAAASTLAPVATDPACPRAFPRPDYSPRRRACFRFNGTACGLVPCPGEAAAAREYLGFVQELPPDPPHAAARPKRGPCRMCRIYPRQCAVSQAHRFVYIHVMKAAGSSAMGFLRAALCPRAPAACAPNGTGTCAPGPPAACDPRALDFMPCAAALDRFPGFFKWTLARHPAARAASAWSMASRFRADGAPAVGFAAWSADAAALRTRALPHHWRPQRDFLFDAGRCPIYDFAGVVDAGLPGDVAAILGRVAAPALSAHHGAHGFPRAFASPGGQSAAALCGAGRAAWAALVGRYRDDFALLGFNASYPGD
jgi:hypothetical protein